MKNDKNNYSLPFRSILQKECRLPKIEIDWLITVLRNGCFHNGPVICPRLGHNGPRKVVLDLGVASGQYNLPWAIMTNRGHITGPLWKHPFINTIAYNKTDIRGHIHNIIAVGIAVQPHIIILIAMHTQTPFMCSYCRCMNNKTHVDI